jgi:hypothetical protein
MLFAASRGSVWAGKIKFYIASGDDFYRICKI